MSSGLFRSSNDLGEGTLCGLQFLMCAPWISNAAKRSQVVSKKYKSGGFPCQNSLENTGVPQN